MLGIQFGGLLGGAVIVEAIFDWPGFGRLLVTSISSRDYAVVQGTILLAASAFLVVNLLTDLTYGLLDPRIRTELNDGEIPLMTVPTIASQDLPCTDRRASRARTRSGGRIGLARPGPAQLADHARLALSPRRRHPRGVS